MVAPESVARRQGRCRAAVPVFEFFQAVVETERRTAMEELNQAYRYAMPAIEEIAAQHDRVSGPLFISVPLAYWMSDVRLRGRHSDGGSHRSCTRVPFSQLALLVKSDKTILR